MCNFNFLDKGLGIVSLVHFVYDFWTEMFLMLYSINWPKSHFIVFFRYWAICVFWNMDGFIFVFCMDFEINFIFLIKLFFLHDQEVMTKTSISWEWKELLRWNKKHFSSFLKGFQLLNCLRPQSALLKNFHLWDSSDHSERHLQ